MCIGAAATGPIRPESSTTRWVSGRSLAAHALALGAVAVTVTVLELPATNLDHGTHLLVLLTLVMGIALLLGPRPAITGFAVGGGVAGVVSVITVRGVFGTPHAYVQLLAYLLAGSAFIVLLSVMRRARSRPVDPPTVTPAMTSDLAGLAGLAGLAEQLTTREVEVLRLAASGITVDEMALRLYVSPNTVKTHLTHIYGKLGVRCRLDAIRAALHSGCLIPTDICPHMPGNGSAESPVQVRPGHPKE